MCALTLRYVQVHTHVCTIVHVHTHIHTYSIVCSLKFSLVTLLLSIMQLSGVAESVLDASQAQKRRNQHSAVPHQDRSGQAPRHGRTGGRAAGSTGEDEARVGEGSGRLLWAHTSDFVRFLCDHSSMPDQ